MPINKEDPKYQASRDMVLEILKDFLSGEDSDPVIEPALKRFTEKRKKAKPRGFDPFDPFDLAGAGKET